MTQVTMTKRGNIRLNGEKFYAVRVQGCTQCVLRGHIVCDSADCTPAGRDKPGYRLAGESVSFVSREAYLSMSGKQHAS